MHISVTPLTSKLHGMQTIVADNNIHFGFLVGDATGSPAQGDPSAAIANTANTIHTFYESSNYCKRSSIIISRHRWY